MDLSTVGSFSIRFGTIGGHYLTTLGITHNYSVHLHFDLQDEGFAFLAWFVKGKILDKLNILIYEYYT